MNVTVTYYLDVVSSWCYWAEPAWAELKQRYAKSPVEFSWKIALLDESAHVEVAGAGGLVLPAQRHHHAFAIHAEFRLADPFEGISSAKLRRGSGQGFWRHG